MQETVAGNFRKLCRLAGDAVVKYDLIREGDRIAAGASGGKDSFALLHVLDHLKRHAPVEFDFTALTFDPGFPGFHTEAVAEYCRAQGWKHSVVALDVPSVIAEKHFEDAPCVLCSRLRRGKLYGAAKALGCNKLALGQHLDDVIASFFMSLARGQGLTTMAPLARPETPEAPTVIRPLALVPEELIRACAAEWGLPQAGRCAYHEQLETGDRRYFRDLTDTLEERIPGVRSNILHSLQKLEADHLMLDAKALQEVFAGVHKHS